MQKSDPFARTNVVAFPARPPAGDPRAEAARRIARLGYARWLAREAATGLPVPAPLRDLKNQIEFVAEALARLDPLPENFRADHFWPA